MKKVLKRVGSFMLALVMITGCINVSGFGKIEAEAADYTPLNGTFTITRKVNGVNTDFVYDKLKISDDWKMTSSSAIMMNWCDKPVNVKYSKAENGNTAATTETQDLWTRMTDERKFGLTKTTTWQDGKSKGTGGSNPPNDWQDRKSAHSARTFRIQTTFKMDKNMWGRTIDEERFHFAIAGSGTNAHNLYLDDGYWVFIYPECLYDEITNDNMWEYFVFGAMWKDDECNWASLMTNDINKGSSHTGHRQITICPATDGNTSMKGENLEKNATHAFVYGYNQAKDRPDWDGTFVIDMWAFDINCGGKVTKPAFGVYTDEGVTLYPSSNIEYQEGDKLAYSKHQTKNYNSLKDYHYSTLGEQVSVQSSLFSNTGSAYKYTPSGVFTPFYYLSSGSTASSSTTFLEQKVTRRKWYCPEDRRYYKFGNDSDEKVQFPVVDLETKHMTLQYTPPVYVSYEPGCEESEYTVKSTSYSRQPFVVPYARRSKDTYTAKFTLYPKDAYKRTDGATFQYWLEKNTGVHYAAGAQLNVQDFDILYDHTNPSTYYSTKLEFVAVWSDTPVSNDKTVRFNVNGGTGNVPSDLKFSSDSETHNTTNIIPTKSGYKFKGWSTNPEYLSSNKRVDYNGNEGATKTGNWTYQQWCDNTGGDSTMSMLVLYAQWEDTSTPPPPPPATKHKVLTVAGTGIAQTYGDGEYETGTTVTVSATVKSSTAQYSYGFTNWTSNNSSVGTSYSQTYSFTMPDSDVTLTANGTQTLRSYSVSCYDVLTFDIAPTSETVYAGSRSYYWGYTAYGSDWGTSKTGYEYTGCTHETVYGSGVTVYRYFTANNYELYYDKGLTTDTTTTDIADATRNYNIQQYGTNRPYTKFTYDRSVRLATIGLLKGRDYKITYDSNKPSSVGKQKNNNSESPTAVSDTTGYLPSLGQWKINGSLYGTGTTPTKPNFTSTKNGTVDAIAQWNSTTISSFTSPTLTGWTFMGWYDNQRGNDSVNESSENSSNHGRQISSKKVVSETIYPSTASYTRTLYARWQRTIHLTFKMQGGQYQGSEDDVVLTGVYYNNADGYNFSLTMIPTPASLPDYEKQQGVIDAYGNYDTNGENGKYIYYDEDTETTYRFLGWSLNPDATEPDSDFIGFISGHKTSYRVYDDTVLYAVWEPVLITNVTLKRTLGDLTFSDGSKPKSTASNVRASSGIQTVEVIAKPGEQCYYQIVTKGKDAITAGIAFDSKIIDIYTHEGIWKDNLNPNTGTGEELNSACGLDRKINISSSNIIRKFYIPQYLGTTQSYDSSKGITVYKVLFEIAQDSYFYRTAYGKAEQAEVLGTIYITNKKVTPDPDPDPTPSPSPDPVISVLDELRAKLKIRLK